MRFRKYIQEGREKTFIGTCVDNPFGSSSKLETIIDDAKEISKAAFMKNVYLDDEIKQAMKRFPHDYEYYKYKDIYFYTWSAIEHFYR